MNKPGRNEPCNCGSGKKYKKCCLEKDMAAEATAIAEERSHEQWEAEQDELLRKGDIEADEFEGDEFEDEDNDGEEDDEEANEEEGGDDEEEEDEEGPESETINIKNKAYPVISADEEKLVEDWWDNLDYEKRPREMQAHIEQFMHSHPHLVENLGLESEALFELGAAYREAGEGDEYIKFLLYVRTAFPSTYIRSAGHYDAAIIAWLIAANRQSEIEAYLGFFKEYPVDFVEQLFEVVMLLEVTDNIEPLVSLATATCNPLMLSDEVFDVNEIFTSLALRVLSKYLHEGFSDQDVTGFVNELTEKMAPYPFTQVDDPIHFWKKTFNNIFRPFTSWPADIPKKKSLMLDRYREVSQNFMRYLHERTGISWTSAWCYSILISQYFAQYLELAKGKIKKQFDFSEKNIDTIVGILAKDMLWINCTKSMSILNAVYYMASYLHDCGNISEAEQLKIQSDCTTLYNQIHPSLTKESFEADCFKTFPYLRASEL